MAWRNVFYDNRSQSIHLWTWDENGNRQKLISSYEPNIYIESNNGEDGVSIFNTPLKKITFKNQFERNKFVNETPIKRLFNNLSCEQDFLLSTFKDEVNKDNFGKYPLKIYFLDIETYSPNAFPVPEKAEDPINLITLYDTLSKKYYTWGTKKYQNQSEDVVYFYCKSETTLLENFLNFFEKDHPDILSSWNGEGFDIPYIINRIKNILGDEESNRLSPVQNIFYRENVALNKFGKVINRYYIRGLSCVDYMELYKTFSRGDRESYSLGYIGQYELGESKIDYGTMSLHELADKDWQKFVDYNIQDVKLLVKLESKLKFLKLIRTLSYKGFIPFEQSLGKVSMITGAVAHQAYKQGYIIPTFKNDIVREAYEGGYVHEPERGLSKAVVGYDANSLYPNTIISLNLSPETKIGKIVKIENDEYFIKLNNEKLISLHKEKFQKLVEKEKLSISKANVLYTQKFKGVIPNLIDRLYQERVETRKEMLAKEREYKKTKDISIKAQIESLDTLQNVFKLTLNSIYGVFAQKFSPLFDIDHSASITLTGQAVVKQASEIVYQQAISQNVNCTKEDIYKYGDTDSCYFSVLPILNHFNLNLLSDNEINKDAYSLIEKLGEHLNEKITEWAKKELHSTDPRFVFKRESICDVALFMEKKRYILHVLDKEGVATNKFKYVGVEIARSTMSESVKKIIKKIIESAMLYNDRKKSNNLLQEGYEEFKKLSIEDLAFRCKISDYEKYESKIKEDGTLGKGTPIHIKSAILFNKMLKKLNIDTVYMSIGSGTKIKYFYAAKNLYNYKSMAFLDVYPKELEEIIKIDYKMMFSKLVEPPIKRLYESIGWPPPTIESETQTDLFDLFAI
jgi:DNA polymerase elongation subunit (family B)